MPLLAAVLLTVLTQDKTATHGKTNAQILAMGRKGWYDFYTGKDGNSTAGMTSAESLYADALGWRNDKFGKSKVMPLRRLLDDVRNHAIEVGTAITGGGTMWNTIATSLDVDSEQTIYTVLTLKGKTKKRVVSDLDKAYRRLERDFSKAESMPEMMRYGREALPLLRKDLDRVLVEARRRPRKASDALLEYCIQAMEAGRME